jgi:hypothetical protein
LCGLGSAAHRAVPCEETFGAESGALHCIRDTVWTIPLQAIVL